MGNKPLTWQEMAIVCLFFALIPAAALIWAADVPPVVHRVGHILSWTIGLLMIVLAVWDIRLHFGKSLFPDVLATLVPPEHVWQIDDCHLVITGEQACDYLRLTCLLQNLYDAPTLVRLQFELKAGGEWLACPVPPLVAALAPGVVARALIDVPLRTVPHAGAISFIFGGSCKAQGGRKVRFARRTAVTRPMQPAIGGGTWLTVPIGAVPPRPPGHVPVPGAWLVSEHWHPGRAEELAKARASPA